MTLDRDDIDAIAAEVVRRLLPVMGAAPPPEVDPKTLTSYRARCNQATAHRAELDRRAAARKKS